MEKSRQDELRFRARELTDELGIDPALQEEALLARLMDLCLLDPDMASTDLLQRLKRLVPSRHAKVLPTTENEEEIESLASIVRQPPGLLERMWRAYLSGCHEEGRGLEGSGKWARVSKEAGRLRDKAIHRASGLKEEFEDCLRGHPTPHPVVAVELLRECLKETSTILDRLDEQLGRDLRMPAVGRKRHRRTGTDQRDLEAYFLCRSKKLASSDPLVRDSFATPTELEAIKDPRIAAKVNRRSSNAVGKMAERVASLEPPSVEAWRGASLCGVSRLADPHRALREFLKDGPPTEAFDIDYVVRLKRRCALVPETPGRRVGFQEIPPEED